MTRYLISFDDGAMTFPEEDLPRSPTAPSVATTLALWLSRPPPKTNTPASRAF